MHLSSYSWTRCPDDLTYSILFVGRRVEDVTSQVSCTFCHTKLHMNSSQMLVVHCYMQILPSVSNLPTWLFVHHIHVKHVLQARDSLLCLSISVRMVAVLKFSFLPKSANKPFKIRSELGIPVKDYWPSAIHAIWKSPHEDFCMSSVLCVT